jgi:hypothetical protein
MNKEERDLHHTIGYQVLVCYTIGEQTRIVTQVTVTPQSALDTKAEWKKHFESMASGLADSRINFSTRIEVCKIHGYPSLSKAEGQVGIWPISDEELLERIEK